MLDSITIISAAESVLKSCTSLYTFISNAKDVDENARSLHNKVWHLGRTAATVKSMLERPGLDTFRDAELWHTASEAMTECEASMRRLDSNFRGLS